MKTHHDVKTFDELLEVKYGKIGTKKRDEFESRSNAFMIGELLKDTRRNARMTQEELARKTGTKKSYISRVENGKIDIQLSTLYRIFESGLGRQISLSIL
jgi:HTH-type transcriptional regulator / antitoxin HipB